MVGFGLEGIEGRIPCPHCGSTDCCGIKFKEGFEGDASKASTICSKTGKVVTHSMLIASAKEHGLMKSECWHFKRNLCKYKDPRHCNKKDPITGETLICPRQGEADALTRQEMEAEQAALEGAGEAEADAIAEQEEDRALEEEEERENEASGPEEDQG